MPATPTTSSPNEATGGKLDNSNLKPEYGKLSLLSNSNS